MEPRMSRRDHTETRNDSNPSQGAAGGFLWNVWSPFETAPKDGQEFLAVPENAVPPDLQIVFWSDGVLLDRDYEPIKAEFVARLKWWHPLPSLPDERCVGGRAQ